MYNAYVGNLENVRFLIERRADPNVKNSRGYTALFFAIVGGHKEVADYLISHGGDLDAAVVAYNPERFGLDPERAQFAIMTARQWYFYKFNFELNVLENNDSVLQLFDRLTQASTLTDDVLKFQFSLQKYAWSWKTVDFENTLAWCIQNKKSLHIFKFILENNGTSFQGIHFQKLNLNKQLILCAQCLPLGSYEINFERIPDDNFTVSKIMLRELIKHGADPYYRENRETAWTIVKEILTRRYSPPLPFAFSDIDELHEMLDPRGTQFL
jgi:hypothetical protein